MSDAGLTTLGLALLAGGVGCLIYGSRYMSNKLPIPAPIGLSLFFGGIAATIAGLAILDSLGIQPHF